MAQAAQYFNSGPLWRYDRSLVGVAVVQDWQVQPATRDRSEVGECFVACGVEPAMPEHVLQAEAAALLCCGGVASVFRSIISNCKFSLL